MNSCHTCKSYPCVYIGASKIVPVTCRPQTATTTWWIVGYIAAIWKTVTQPQALFIVNIYFRMDGHFSTAYIVCHLSIAFEVFTYFINCIAPHVHTRNTKIVRFYGIQPEQMPPNWIANTCVKVIAIISIWKLALSVALMVIFNYTTLNIACGNLCWKIRPNESTKFHAIHRNMGSIPFWQELLIQIKSILCDILPRAAFKAPLIWQPDVLFAIPNFKQAVCQRCCWTWNRLPSCIRTICRYTYPLN